MSGDKPNGRRSGRKSKLRSTNKKVNHPEWHEMPTPLKKIPRLGGRRKNG